MKQIELQKQFSFDASHCLPNLEDGHKCKRLHGHTFKVIITIRGIVDPQKGWVMDFSEITKLVQPLIDQLDHHYLNEIEDLENPTSENIAIWVWDHLKPDLPLLHAIQIKESETSTCTYKGLV